MYPPITPNIKQSDIFPDYHFQVMDKHMLGGAPAGFIIVFLENYNPSRLEGDWRKEIFKNWMKARTWNDEIKYQDSGEWSYLGYMEPEIFEMYDTILKLYFYDLNDAMFFKMVWG